MQLWSCSRDPVKTGRDLTGCSAESSRYFGGIGLSSGIPGGGSEYLEGSRRSFGTGVSGSADCL